VRVLALCLSLSVDQREKSGITTCGLKNHVSAGMAATALPSMAPLPSLESQLPDCPATKWSVDNIDIAAEQVSIPREDRYLCSGSVNVAGASLVGGSDCWRATLVGIGHQSNGE